MAKKEFVIKVRGQSVQVFYAKPVIGYLNCGDEYDVVVFNKKLMNDSDKELAKKMKEILDKHCEAKAGEN